MRRVGGRMRNKNLALNWQEWYKNYKADIASMWKNRMDQLQVDLDAMTLKFNLTTNTAGESIMRNVAQRMRNQEIAAAVIVWKEGLDEQKSRERGERIMRRVGKRMLNREASDAVMGWRESQIEE